MPLVGNPTQQRRWMPKNSHQQHEQLNKEKNGRTQDLTRFGYFFTSLGQGERVLIESINYRLQDPDIRDPSLYSKETRKKRKPKIPNSDQKRIQNQIQRQAAQQYQSTISQLITFISRLIHVLVNQFVVKQICQLSAFNHPWFLLCNPTSI